MPKPIHIRVRCAAPEGAQVSLYAVAHAESDVKSDGVHQLETEAGVIKLTLVSPDPDLALFADGAEFDAILVPAGLLDQELADEGDEEAVAGSEQPEAETASEPTDANPVSTDPAAETAPEGEKVEGDKTEEVKA